MSVTSYEIKAKGPLFDGRTSANMKKFAEALTRELAEMLRDHVLAGTAIYKNPTGYYKSHITTKNQPGSSIVTDQDVVYGPWLERGPRGGPASTGFSGYHLWQKAFEDTRTKVQVVGDRLIGKYLK